jgi:phosphopantetheine adenylyltransferase
MPKAEGGKNSPSKNIGDDIAGKSETAFFVFGRFNPPHKGHKVLVEALLAKAGEAGADPYVFVTSTQDKKKNPLYVHEKVELLKKMFPSADKVRIINTTKSACKTVPAVIGRLKDAGYKKIVMVAAGERVADFTGKFEVEKGVPLEVVSGGERDPDSEGVEGLSATKMRTAAGAANLAGFRAGLDEAIGAASAEKLIEKIRGRMSGGTRKTKKIRRTRG